MMLFIDWYCVEKYIKEENKGNNKTKITELLNTDEMEHPGFK